MRGADKAARFIVAISRETPGVCWQLTTLNRRPGVLVHRGDKLFAALDTDVTDGQISTVRVQMNPAKLSAARGGSGDNWLDP